MHNKSEILFENIEIFDTGYKQKSVFFGTKHANDDVEKVFLLTFVIKQILLSIICMNIQIDKNQIINNSFR